MSSSKDSLEVSIGQSQQRGRIIKPSIDSASLFGSSERGILINSASGFGDGGIITLESGDSFDGAGGEILLHAGESKTGGIGGKIELISGTGGNSGRILIKSGEYDTPLTLSERGHIYVQSEERLELRSGDDILISPMPKPTYTSVSGNVLIYGQSDNTADDPGRVDIRGGNMALNGSYFNRAGDINILGGKANNGLQDSETWGGYINLIAYGYGNLTMDAYYVDIKGRASGVNLYTEDRTNPSEYTGGISISTGSFTGSTYGSSSSGDLSIKTSNSNSGTAGSINIGTGKTYQGVGGDIDIKVGDNYAGGTAGVLTIEGASGFTDSSGGDIHIYSGDSNLSGTPGDVVIGAGTADEPTSKDAATKGKVFIRGGAVEDFDFSLLDSDFAYAGDVLIEGGSFLGLNNGNGGIFGGSVTIRGGAVSGNSILEKRGSVAIDGRTADITGDDEINLTAPSVTTTADNGSIEFSAVSGSIETTAENITTTATDTVSLSGLGVEIDAGTNFTVSSSAIVSDAPNKLMALGNNNVLRALGISILGSGSVSFDIDLSYHVDMIPLFFQDMTYNTSGSQDIRMGHLNNNENTLFYPETTEEYTGLYSPIDSSGNLLYDNVKVLSFVTSTSSFMEIDGSSYLYVGASFVYATKRYLQLRYSDAAGHANVVGIANYSNGSISIKVNYIVIA
jgi:hypothetical protein